ncbi:MAG: YvcK family protein [Chloroherpetonaceae bacterium]|nr:YvcK family protein [Chloroherpetonaceae bacterium]
MRHAYVKWLYPGMRVKRWIALGALGLGLLLLGVGIRSQTYLPGEEPPLIRAARWTTANVYLGMPPFTMGLAFSIGGALLGTFAFIRLLHSLVSALRPDMSAEELADEIYARRRLAQGRRIVVIGGGTGLSTLLRGLKQYSSNLTAVVTVADDGGSSGKLKRQLNILPPGDIRNCLVALADAEPQMTELFQYRFRNAVGPRNGAVATVPTPVAVGASGGAAGVPERVDVMESYGEGLRDHAFGNLLIAAMCAINGGDFERAVLETSRVLNVRGRVLPSTVAHVRLKAEMEDGSILEGETTIAESPLKIRRVMLDPPDAPPVEDVLEAIAQADIIVLGPGSVFTSILPNLLVQGIVDAIHRSRARKVYVCNVMTQPGETDGFTACDHVAAIERHVDRRIFEYVLVNTGQPGPELLEKYRKSGSVLVEPDTDRIKRAGYRPITGNFINETDVVRHNAHRLAEAIIRLLD